MPEQSWIRRPISKFVLVALVTVFLAQFVTGRRWLIYRWIEAGELVVFSLWVTLALLVALGLTRVRRPAFTWLAAGIAAQGVASLIWATWNLTSGLPRASIWPLWEAASPVVLHLCRIGLWWGVWLSLRAWLLESEPTMLSLHRKSVWGPVAATLGVGLMLLSILAGDRVGPTVGLALAQLSMLANAVGEGLFWSALAALGVKVARRHTDVTWLAGAALLLAMAWFGGGPTIMFTRWGPLLWVALSLMGVLALSVWARKLWRS